MADHADIDHTGLTGVTGATRASLALDTTDAPQFAGINLGHASDTTLTRVSAGVVAIEGTNVVKAGAATASGLTMATARLLGRDTASTGAIEEITLGTNLSFSGTTLNASGGGSITTDSISLSGSTVSVTSGADATILARTLASGTWILFAQITIQAASPGADYYMWIDNGGSVVGSGQTTIAGNLWAASIPIVCLVTPGGSTTYTIKARSSGATGTVQISTPNGTKGLASNFVCLKVA